jgi:hypothetical protein
MLHEYSLWKEISAGATAGVVGTVLGYPLDRLEQFVSYQYSYERFLL